MKILPGTVTLLITHSISDSVVKARKRLETWTLRLRQLLRAFSDVVTGYECWPILLCKFSDVATG